MFIADAFCRTYRLTTEDAKHDCSEVRALREVQYEGGFSVSPTRLEEFKRDTAIDPEMQIFISAINKGWPLSRKEYPAKLVPYYDSRSELVEDSRLVYLVVPRLLRADMLNEIHGSRIGIGGCLRRAQELLYWPRINAEVREYA